MFIWIIVNVQNVRKTKKTFNFEHIFDIFSVQCNWFVLILFASCQTSPGTGLEYRVPTTHTHLFWTKKFLGQNFCRTKFVFFQKNFLFNIFFLSIIFPVSIVFWNLETSIWNEGKSLSELKSLESSLVFVNIYKNWSLVEFKYGPSVIKNCFDQIFKS